MPSTRRSASLASQPAASTHGMQTRSRTSKSPTAARESRAPPSVATPKSGRYGAPVEKRVGGTDAGANQLSGQALGNEEGQDRKLSPRPGLEPVVEESEESSSTHTSLHSRHSSEPKSATKEVPESGISDAGSSKDAKSSTSSSNDAASVSNENQDYTLTTDQLILLINTNVDKKVEEKLQPIHAVLERNSFAFIGEAVTLLLWFISLAFILSVASLFVSSISNPYASDALLAVSYPARVAFGMVAPTIPQHGTNCSRFVRDLNDWNQVKQIELANFRAKVEEQLKTSESRAKSFAAMYQEHEIEFQKRVSIAEEAAITCAETGRMLETKIENLRQELDGIRRQHEAWREQEVNFLSIHMGAVIIPGKTSPTAKHGTTLVGRLVHNFLVPRRGYPATAALLAWGEPGECWCGAGTDITLGVALSQPAYPTVFTLEHVPQLGGLDMGSKPKEIELWAHVVEGDLPVGVSGCVSPQPGIDWVCILKKQVLPASAATGSESWYVEGTENAAVDRVVVAVTANYGNPLSTCLYRVKLAGEPLLPAR